MKKRLSYAEALAAGWWFVTTGDWRCYAWRVRDGIVEHTPLCAMGVMGDDRDIGSQYRHVLAALTEGCVDASRI